MDQLIELIKITLPSLIVFGVVYYLLNQFLKEKKLENNLKLISSKDYFPVRMQAYEGNIVLEN